MSRGGIVVLLSGAHRAAARPLVQTLLDGHAPGDPAAPCVRICFTPRELLDVPPKARAVLVGADAEPSWLNLHRPIIRERALALLLWLTVEQIATLRRFAPDFLDWVSHRIDVPPPGPSRAVLEFDRSVSRGSWLAIAGDELLTRIVAEVHLPAESTYEEFLEVLDAGDVVIHGVEHERDLWRLMLAHAQTQWRHRVFLYEPLLVPPVIRFIDGRPQSWEQRSARLEAARVKEPRLVAALEDDRAGAAEAVPQVLHPNPAVMQLLGAVARQDVGPAAVSQAKDLELYDVADALESLIPSGLERTGSDSGRVERRDAGKPAITPERFARALARRGKELRALFEDTEDIVKRAVWRATRRNSALFGERDDIAQEVLLGLFGAGRRTLERWDAGTPFEDFVSRAVALEVSRLTKLRQVRGMPADDDGSDAAKFIDSVYMLEKTAYRDALGQIEAFLSHSGTPRDRRLFEALFIHDRTIGDVARELGLSANFVSQWRSRLRRRLQIMFPDLLPDR